jgi:hypothetical protein
MKNLLQRIATLATTLSAVARLPLARLRFDAALSPAHVNDAYRLFTRPHPKFPLVRRKAIGAALLDLTQFGHGDDYLRRIRELKGGHYVKRAQSRAYLFRCIDRNDYIDDIDAINNALPVRQGKPMPPSYTERKEGFADRENYAYFGVVDPGGRLVAYCELGYYGNFAVLSRLLGQRNNSGTMHFMIAQVAQLLIAERSVSFLMYDMYFGASEGLRHFKTMLGFVPYRVKYALTTGPRPLPAMLRRQEALSTSACGSATNQG